VSGIEPPVPKRSPDPEALLRFLMREPVPPLPEDEALRLRDQITRGLEARRVVAPRGRWRPWVVFAAAACLPVAIWAATSLVHPAPQPSDAALVRVLGGPAAIARGDAERSIAGKGSAPLGPGDELRTGQDASARASLPTGAVVDVGPWARVRFSAARDGAAMRDRLELVAGRVDVRVPKLPAGSEVRVQTADATVVVHGTQFLVERVAAAAERPASTRVSVTQGVVTVDTASGQRTLTAGMDFTTGEPAATPSDATPAPAVATSAADGLPSAPGASSRSTLGAENALLSDAMRLRRDRQDDRALALVDAFVERYPGSPLLETARVERLRILEEAGAMDRLRREAERYLADYPRGYAREEAGRMLAAARASSP
jgi:hypothetical protein